MPNFEGVPLQLKRVADLLEEGQQPSSVTVRELLSWFDAQRRGYYVIQTIDDAMQKLGIHTSPDFESAYIDGYINFEKLIVVMDEVPLDIDDGSLNIEEIVVDEEGEKYVAGSISDPTYQVRRLRAANNKPIFINPESTIGEAVMLMTMYEYSQLTVMTSQHAVKGIISWMSIGRALFMKKDVMLVKDCMDSAYEVKSDETLFSAMASIIRHEYVLVREEKAGIVGIMTPSDLSVQFRELSEPFFINWRDRKSYKKDNRW